MASLLVVCMGLISLSFARSNSTIGEIDKTKILSPFSLSFYKALSSEKIFDKIFDITFSPGEVAAEFYHNSFFFARQLGFKHPGRFSAKVAAASKRAFKNITPLQYFNVFATTMETFFKDAGLSQKYDQQQLLRSFVKSLKKAVKSVGGKGPKAALKALAVGSINMFKSLGEFTSDQVKSILEIFTKELNKIH